MRVIGKGRNTIEPFVEREWSAENADRFAGAVAPPNWEWREYCLAAHDGEELIGAAIFRVRGGVAHLKNVISSRARRSQGIGGALVDEFVRRARTGLPQVDARYILRRQIGAFLPAAWL
jgi:GNAT superfamily N-acetyltransferase